MGDWPDGDAHAPKRGRSVCYCLNRLNWLNRGSRYVAQLAALRAADSYERGDIVKKSAWVTMPGDRSWWPEPQISALRRFRRCAERSTDGIRRPLPGLCLYPIRAKYSVSFRSIF
jgi:hypothetical protein